MKKTSITVFTSLVLLSSGCGIGVQELAPLSPNGTSLVPYSGFRTQSTPASTSIDWIREFGTANDDYPQGIAVDACGNTFVMGNTYGTFPGQSSEGGVDAFVRKYDVSGNVVWTSQLGTSKNEGAKGIALDADGNIYLVGSVGDEFSNVVDTFVRKCDPNGKELWVRQFGTSTLTYAQGVAVDASGNVYVAGNTYGNFVDGQANIGVVDSFVRKYDASGNEQWTRQFGTSYADYAQGIAVDAGGNVYVAGHTFGTLPNQTSQGQYDAYLRKYDASGNELWTHQFGTSNDENVYGLRIDSIGDVYVTGKTFGNFPGYSAPGNPDAFVRKYDASGNALWTHQLRIPAGDNIENVSVDASGNTYITGSTKNTAGDSDIIVRMYSARGIEGWSRQFGTSNNEDAKGITIDTNGSVFVAGYTQGTMSDQSNAGMWDGFLAKVTADALPAIAVDIKPGDPKNTIKLHHKSRIPFALLSTAAFDATQVDPHTVTLAGAKAIKWAQKDVDGDGQIDLLLYAKTQDLQLTRGATTVLIKGETFDGKTFECSDSVIVKK